MPLDIKFTLEPLAPFRLDLTVWVLRRRAENTWDRWDGHTYYRVLPTPSGSLEIAATQSGTPDAPRLDVAVTSARITPDTQSMATVALNRLLGLQIDLTEFYGLAAADPLLGPLAERFRGFKPPRFLDLFEALVNGIACQQLTLTQGIRLQAQLVAKYGASSGDIDVSPHAYMRPSDLLSGDPEALRAMGFSRQKSRALLTIASDVAEGRLDLQGLEALDDESARSHLLALRGIGRWTAEYVQLRGLGRLHVFPGDDVGARKNLRGWLQSDDPTDYEGVRRLVAPWQPYAGLLYFHLLLDRLADAGHLS